MAGVSIFRRPYLGVFDWFLFADVTYTVISVRYHLLLSRLTHYHHCYSPPLLVSPCLSFTILCLSNPPSSAWSRRCPAISAIVCLALHK